MPVGGPRNGARYWTGTPTLAGAQFREPKRLRSFGKLLKHPIPKDDMGYLKQRLLAMVAIGSPLCPIGAVVV